MKTELNSCFALFFSGSTWIGLEESVNPHPHLVEEKNVLGFPFICVFSVPSCGSRLASRVKFSGRDDSLTSLHCILLDWYFSAFVIAMTSFYFSPNSVFICITSSRPFLLSACLHFIKSLSLSFFEVLVLYLGVHRRVSYFGIVLLRSICFEKYWHGRCLLSALCICLHSSGALPLLILCLYASALYSLCLVVLGGWRRGKSSALVPCSACLTLFFVCFDGCSHCSLYFVPAAL